MLNDRTPIISPLAFNEFHFQDTWLAFGDFAPDEYASAEFAWRAVHRPPPLLGWAGEGGFYDRSSAGNLIPLPRVSTMSYVGKEPFERVG